MNQPGYQHKEDDLTAARLLKAQQLAWAIEAGKKPDRRGYLPTVQANLFRPLHEQTRREFQRGSGGELRGHGTRPAKMRALHSSAVLACNVFDYWRDRDKQLLTRALGLPQPIHHFSFEAQLPTGLEGTPPNLDLLLELNAGGPVAVESKFTESYSGKSATEPFKAKYFPKGKQLWAGVGLPHCQALAGAIHKKGVRFAVLNAAQLLKHALGVATAYGSEARLLYLYFDTSGDEGERHRLEVEQFTGHVEGELSFGAMSYQSVLGRLFALLEPGDGGYRNYLQTRYLRSVPIQQSTAAHV